jgi:hypothetical protein
MNQNCSTAKLISSAILLTAATLAPAACFATENSAQMPEMRWRMIGPFRGGRTRAAAGVPDQLNVFYVGQVDGGVWKSLITAAHGIQSSMARIRSPSEPSPSHHPIAT